MKGLKKVSLWGIICLIMVGLCYVPTYTKMYKHRLNAKVALVNDDLKGALISFEKAYEQIPMKSLEQEIKQLLEKLEIEVKMLQNEKDLYKHSAYVDLINEYLT